MGEQLTDNLGIIMTLTSQRELDIKDVVVKDGETLVLGGLIQEYETKSQKKYPILGDLPVFGALFRSSTRDKQKTELIIMITPKIIKDDEKTNI
jgi:type IV pilus assembly protein PilQ